MPAVISAGSGADPRDIDDLRYQFLKSRDGWRLATEPTLAMGATG